MDNTTEIKYMMDWCAKEGLRLNVKGEVGFARDCVGLETKDGDCYPDYEWYDDEYEARIDPNGEVWTPENAYHKHPCTAVLVHNDDYTGAIHQLYRWVAWFDFHGFHYKVTDRKCDNEIELMMGRNKHHTLVRSK